MVTPEPGLQPTLSVVSGIDCVSDPMTGPCKGYFPRWFFNSTSQTCQKFIYGGCGGNLNNFAFEKECEVLCQGELAFEVSVSADWVCYQLGAEMGKPSKP